MKKIKQSLLATLLVLCFLIINISTTLVSAVEPGIVYDEYEGAHKMIESTVSIDTEQTSPLVLESLHTDDCMISKYVSADQFNKASHVKRLSAEEELDTYVFLNSDGTKSVYYMDENVKFFDKNGNIKEKDVTLVSESDGYGIVRNEFDLHIPNSAASGISMSYNGYDVKIMPQSTARTDPPARQVDETIVYDGFFGTNTCLVYTPMLSGIKEDVIMKAYIPNAEFRFILDTDGLGLYNNDEGYYLAESESSEVILKLGKVIIYDTIGKPDYGTMNVTTVTANQKYILSLSAPEEFLTDPTTVYPVTIDPTLTVSDTATGDGAIEDTVLFSNRPSKNYGDYKYLSIGYVDSTYGAGRVAVKLPGLYNSAEYQNITASEITSVQFYCRDSSGNSAQNINLYRITSAAWDENTVTYGDSVTYSTSTNWGTSLPNAVSTAFDITTLVKGWKNGTYAASKGFILINPNETSASYKKAPFSSEYTNAQYRPYVVMTYDVGDVGISLNVSEISLQEGQTHTLAATTSPAGQTVYWTSLSTAIAVVDNNGKISARKAGSCTIGAYIIDANGQRQYDYCEVNVYIPNGVYYFNNVSNDFTLQLNQSTAYNENSGTLLYDLGTDMPTQRWAMFKLYYHGNCEYSIRSMLDSSMGLVFQNGYSMPVCATIGTGTAVPDKAKWVIKSNSNGYYIHSKSNDDYTFTSGVPAGPNERGCGITLTPYSSTNILQNWTISPITTEYNGVEIVSKTLKLATGKTFDYDAVMYSCISIVNGQNGIVWAVANGTGNASINASTGELTGLSAGTVTVTAAYVRSSITTWSTSIEVHIIPIREGVYFINNREKGGYLQIDDNASNNYSESGVHMEHHEFDGEDYQKWRFVYLNNGFYKIQSVESGLCLAVPADGINESDVDIVQESYSNLPRKQWAVVPTTNGAFKIRNRDVTNDLVLCVNAGIGFGGNVQQDDYVNNNSYLDEWILIFPSDLSLIALPENYDRTSFFDDVINEMERIGYTNYYENQNTVSRAATDGELIGRMASSKITIIRTHGSYNSIVTGDGHLYRFEILNLPDGVFDLSQIIIYGACQTGEGRENADNLVNATYEKGGFAVIGFEKNVINTEVNLWCQAFAASFADGNTINQAAVDATEYVKSEWLPTHLEEGLRTDSYFIASDNKFATYHELP